MSVDRRRVRGSRGFPRQVIMLVIILAGMLVLLTYFRDWADKLGANSAVPAAPPEAAQ